MASSNDSLEPLGGQEDFHPAQQSAAEKLPYRAYEPSKHEQRHLEIRLKFPEPAECPSYGLLTNIRAEWRTGQAITLEYGKTMMVMIRGENLTEVYRAIKERKAEWIAEFNTEEHDPQPDGEPFIQSITIHTTRPEEPPPVSKRH